MDIDSGIDKDELKHLAKNVEITEGKRKRRN